MRYKFLIVTFFISYFFFSGFALEKNFVIVIDAGHGGKDPGAIGPALKLKEKNLNLDVALLVGKQIEKNHPDVKVVYTRKTDVFVELTERSKIANKAKSDLFVSIHANSLKRTTSGKETFVQGAETYILGSSNTKENLEVVKRENSVILLEDNYEQKYEGFDPNSIDSYIIFDIMQNQYKEESISFASGIQKEFKSNAKRVDRGVKQAGYLVLLKTGAPSVLVELGYLTNKAEEKYLSSDVGQQKMATSIYNAFLKYKREYDKKMGVFSAHSTSAQEKTNSVKEKQEISTQSSIEGVIYKIQILISSVKLSNGSPKLKSYKDVDFYIDNGIYKYTYGKSTDFNEIEVLRKKISKDFKDAFIVTFKEGKRIK